MSEDEELLPCLKKIHQYNLTSVRYVKFLETWSCYVNIIHKAVMMDLSFKQ